MAFVIIFLGGGVALYPFINELQLNDPVTSSHSALKAPPAPDACWPPVNMPPDARI
ncbi:hypothetical protein [Pseudomonas sp. GM30]|uniref:hypothetical protein n=1 Tax=Pseudomonas sp. GM30 TaxID=1144328 RepID=UPI00135F1ACF|nr:hypothetical protein [Pseudomonas sp. GM30]